MIGIKVLLMGNGIEDRPPELEKESKGAFEDLEKALEEDRLIPFVYTARQAYDTAAHISQAVTKVVETLEDQLEPCYEVVRQFDPEIKQFEKSYQDAEERIANLVNRYVDRLEALDQQISLEVLYPGALGKNILLTHGTVYIPSRKGVGVYSVSNQGCGEEECSEILLVFKDLHSTPYATLEEAMKKHDDNGLGSVIVASGTEKLLLLETAGPIVQIKYEEKLGSTKEYSELRVDEID